MNNVYTIKDVGRPTLPDHLLKDKMLPIRFTQGELEKLKASSKRFDVTLSHMIREGLKLYLTKLERQGEPRRKEKI